MAVPSVRCDTDLPRQRCGSPGPSLFLSYPVDALAMVYAIQPTGKQADVIESVQTLDDRAPCLLYDVVGGGIRKDQSVCVLPQPFLPSPHQFAECVTITLPTPQDKQFILQLFASTRHSYYESRPGCRFGSIFSKFFVTDDPARLVVSRRRSEPEEGLTLWTDHGRSDDVDASQSVETARTLRRFRPPTCLSPAQ